MRRPRSLVDRIELGPREFFLRSNGQFARFVDARRLRPDVSCRRHRSLGVRFIPDKKIPKLFYESRFSQFNPRY